MLVAVRVERVQRCSVSFHVRKTALLISFLALLS